MIKVKENEKIFYGPLLSRRFGYSLGIDIIPFKICSYDCIYCQLGKTTCKTIERRKYKNINSVNFKKDLKNIIDENLNINYITLAGLGEPTLNSQIGQLIYWVKEVTEIPVLILTNGSLLHSTEVINEIKEADLIKVSFDAADEQIFKKINNPFSEIKFNMVLDGLGKLISNYNGKIWLEIMLIKGVNDSVGMAEKFKSVISLIDKNKIIEKIQVNTPIRPSGAEDVSIPDEENLKYFEKQFGEKIETIKDLKLAYEDENVSDLKCKILNLCKRRPSSLIDLSNSLRINMNQVIKCLRILTKEEKIRFKICHDSKYYYSPENN
jgi:wyosine [tRNA(Phe)-imidazoG37] synthetase (radical SAM superfamily)